MVLSASATRVLAQAANRPKPLARAGPAATRVRKLEEILSQSFIPLAIGGEVYATYRSILRNRRALLSVQMVNKAFVWQRRTRLRGVHSFIDSLYDGSLQHFEPDLIDQNCDTGDLPCLGRWHGISLLQAAESHGLVVEANLRAIARGALGPGPDCDDCAVSFFNAIRQLELIPAYMQFKVGCPNLMVGTAADLLCIDKNGKIVVVEMKCGAQRYAMKSGCFSVKGQHGVAVPPPLPATRQNRFLLQAGVTAELLRRQFLLMPSMVDFIAIQVLNRGSAQKTNVFRATAEIKTFIESAMKV